MSNLPKKNSLALRFSPEMYYTQAPLCLWCYGMEPYVEGLFSAVRAVYPKVKIEVLTGFNWFNPSNPVYREYAQKKWREYEELAEHSEEQLPPLNWNLWNSGVNQASSLEAAVAAQTAGFQDKAGSGNIHWSMTRALSRSVFSGNVEVTLDSVVELAADVQLALRRNGVSFSVEDFRADLAEGRARKMLDDNYERVKRMLRDAYPGVDEETIQDLVGYPLIFGRPSPRERFWVLFPRISSPISSHISAAIRMLSPARSIASERYRL